MKLKSNRLSRSFSRFCNGRDNGGDRSIRACDMRDATGMETDEVKWELRPGGMLVQKRETRGEKILEGFITIRVTTVSKWHDISIQATSTFGELKTVLSAMTGLEVKEQRLLFKGKERDDREYLHMVGVNDKDKVLLLEDPTIKERNLLGIAKPNSYKYRTISAV